MKHSKPTLRLVLHTPRPYSTDSFLALDPFCAFLWTNSKRIAKLPLSSVQPSAANFISRTALRSLYCALTALPNVNLPIVDTAEFSTGSSLFLSTLLYIAELGIYLGASDKLELVLLDIALRETFKISCSKPILSIEYKQGLIVVGCVACVFIFPLAKHAEKYEGRCRYIICPAILEIDDFDSEEWIRCTLLDTKLYVACECSVYVYSREGVRLHSMNKIHELSITCILLHEELFITASKDKTIKVWSVQNHLIYSFNAHNAAVTGIAIAPTLKNTILLLSCSLDGALKLWDLEKRCCIHEQATHDDILGIGFLTKDTFFHYSRQCIYVWNMNQFLTTFTNPLSCVQLLQKCVFSMFNFNNKPKVFNSTERRRSILLRRNSIINQVNALPVIQSEKKEVSQMLSRIIIVTEDGAVRLMSPVTGASLKLCYPIFKQTTIVSVLHNIDLEILYTLMNNGELVIYETNFNPCKLSEIINVPEAAEYKVTCFDAFIHPKFLIFGGTNIGTVVLMSTSVNTFKFLCQGHKTPISQIVCHGYKPFVATLCDCVKIWVYVRETSSLHLFHILDFADPFKCLFVEQMEPEDMLTIMTTETIVTADTIRLVLDCPMLAIAVDTKLFTWHESATWTHPATDDHTAPIVSMSFNYVLGLIATASNDGTVKVWTMECRLVREVMVGQIVYAVAFVNRRCDLIVGTANEVCLLSAKDYLPQSKSKKITEMNIPNDIIEEPSRFDRELDFWSAIKKNSQLAGLKWDFGRHNHSPESKVSKLEYMRKKSEDRSLDELSDEFGLDEIEDSGLTDKMVIDQWERFLHANKDFENFRFRKVVGLVNKRPELDEFKAKAYEKYTDRYEGKKLQPFTFSNQPHMFANSNYLNKIQGQIVEQAFENVICRKEITPIKHEQPPNVFKLGKRKSVKKEVKSLEQMFEEKTIKEPSITLTEKSASSMDLQVSNEIFSSIESSVQETIQPNQKPTKTVKSILVKKKDSIKQVKLKTPGKKTLKKKLEKPKVTLETKEEKITFKKSAELETIEESSHSLHVQELKVKTEQKLNVAPFILETKNYDPASIPKTLMEPKREPVAVKQENIKQSELVKQENIKQSEPVKQENIKQQSLPRKKSVLKQRHVEYKPIGSTELKSRLEKTKDLSDAIEFLKTVVEVLPLANNIITTSTLDPTFDCIFKELGQSNFKLQSILGVLGMALRGTHDPSKEMTMNLVAAIRSRMEAARILSAIYASFKNDLGAQDCKTLCLDPILNSLSAEACPEVRAYITALLPKCLPLNKEVLLALLLRVFDPVESVRETALQSLESFDILCNEDLKNVMLKFGIVTKEDTMNASSKHRSILDDMYAECLARDERLVIDTEEHVADWMLQMEMYALESGK